MVTGVLLADLGLGNNHQAQLVSAQGYECFGSLLPGRNFSSSSYRFGFNGQEKVDEVNGSIGTHNTAEFWEYDPRTGRRWNLDPKPQIAISDYAAFGLNPILLVDPLGDEVIGTDKRSARRIERNMKKETFGAERFSAFRSLIHRKGDRFQTIDEAKFNEAMQDLSPDDHALARGYKDAINAPEKLFVQVVRQGERIMPIHDEMSVGIKTEATVWGLAWPIGRELDQQWAGGLTTSVGDQSLSVVLMNPRRALQDYRTWGGLQGYHPRPATMGEMMAHEVIGHGWGAQVDQATTPITHHRIAIQVGNLFLRVVYSQHGLFRDGTDHGGGEAAGRRMLRPEAMDTPRYLK